MNSRNTILNKIKSIPIEPCSLPSMDFTGEVSNSLERFKISLALNGARVIEIENETLVDDVINDNFPTTPLTLSGLSDQPGLINVADIHSLEKVELAILKGSIGVAENGAIWLEEKNMYHRALPFITQDLVLIVKSSSIVGSMHEAYDLIDMGCDYGIFISGPSKTADIEQSLVIGAHGAKSLLVLIFMNL